jgi:UDP-glucose 4-epimerase
LGTGKGVSVQEVVDVARRVTGKAIPTRAAPRRAGDPARLTASSAKAASVLGWTAAHSDMATLIATSWAIYKKD